MSELKIVSDGYTELFGRSDINITALPRSGSDRKYFIIPTSRRTKHLSDLLITLYPKDFRYRRYSGIYLINLSITFRIWEILISIPGFTIDLISGNSEVIQKNCTVKFLIN
jgi:hypothetical protein